MAVTWKGVLANSLGPWLPKPAWRRLAHHLLGSSLQQGVPFLLTEGQRRSLERRGRDEARDPRPPRDTLRLRVALLRRADSGNFRKASLAMWGVDERDPTADPRLIDFCLSLPPEQLLRRGMRRPLLRAALADRLPAEVLDPVARGYQMADWFEQILPEDVRRVTSSLETCAKAAELVDFGRIHAMIDDWPTGGWGAMARVIEYRMALLRALAAAHFIAAVETQAA
jgi:asparagine synthase (glutamine-hydrolysing)